MAKRLELEVTVSDSNEKITYKLGGVEISKDDLIGVKVPLDVAVWFGVADWIDVTVSIKRGEVQFSIDDILSGIPSVIGIRVLCEPWSVNRCQHSSVCLDLTGIEELRQLELLEIDNPEHVDFRIRSLQGIEFCTALKGLILKNIDRCGDELSLTPLSFLDLKRLDVEGSKITDLHLVNAQKVIVDYYQGPILRDMLSHPPANINHIKVVGFNEVFSRLICTSQYRDFRDLLIPVQAHLRENNPKAWVSCKVNVYNVDENDEDDECYDLLIEDLVSVSLDDLLSWWTPETRT